MINNLKANKMLSAKTSGYNISEKGESAKFTKSHDQLIQLIFWFDLGYFINEQSKWFMEFSDRHW